MSLVAQALVVATHGVLNGRTWAGDRVLMQPIMPIDEVLAGAGDAQKPVLAVFCESTKAETEGREAQGNMVRAELKVFVYICPGRVDTGDMSEFQLDSTTAGLSLNMVGRQIDAALMASSGLWIDAWRKMVIKITEREARYILVEIENGIRVPTMEICYRVDTVPEPDFGNPMTVAWQKLDSALRQTAEGVTLANLFKAMIEEPAGLPDYVDLVNNHGLTPAGLVGTGLGPVTPAAVDDDGFTVPLEGVDFNSEFDIVTPDPGSFGP